MTGPKETTPVKRDGRIRNRLAELGIALPEPKAPVANYVGCKQSGDHLFVSALVSVLRGRVGLDVTVAEARSAARHTTIRLLSIIEKSIGDLDRIQAIDKITGFVHSASDFTQQPAVIDGASDLLVQVFGESGSHARTSTGMAQLPFGAAVQLEMMLRLGPAAAGLESLPSQD